MSQLALPDLRHPYIVAANGLRQNPEQWAAYESEGHCVVLAGPGSGKTKTLTTKLARMLHEDVAPPRGIACITYNSECADELKRRLEFLGVQEGRRVYVGTIHAFCLKNVLLPYARLAGLALPFDVKVALASEQEKAFVDAFSKVYGGTPPSGWKTDFDKYRRTHLDRKHASWYGDDADMARLIEVYETDLRERGAIDFDDMVLLGLQLVENHEWVRRCLRARFPILAVDEYQDLGMPLHRIVLSLCFKAGVRLFAVGDPDQSIYGFAGARPELLEELSNMSGIQKIQLQFNYRAGQTIIDAAEAVLGEERGYRATGQTQSTINFYKCPQGLEQQAAHICTKIIPAALARRKGRSLGDVAVLYLDWRDGEVIEEAVRNSQMKFLRLDRGAPYAKSPFNRWIEECAAWCAGGWKKNSPRLSVLIRGWEKFNPTVRSETDVFALRLDLLRFLFSQRDPKQEAHDWLSAFDRQLLNAALSGQPALRDELHAFEGMRRAYSDQGRLKQLTLGALGGQSGGGDHLNLITLHSAKGLEFDVVVMMGMDQGRIPNYRANTPEKKREPRRLFYVGLTRARHEIHLTCSGFTLGPGGRRFDNGPSEFLIEVSRRMKQNT